MNLGTGREVQIRELAELVRAACGYFGRIVWDATKPNGQPRRCLDVSRARERFGFEARTSFAEGLRRTVEWYLQNRERADRGLTGLPPRG